MRAIASATLAGMIKGMSDEGAAGLRAELLGQARALLLAAGAKRPADATQQANAATLLQKHGVVLVRGGLLSGRIDLFEEFVLRNVKRGIFFGRNQEAPGRN